MNITSLTVFSTSHCHLCEQAIAMLEELHQKNLLISYEIVDIADNDQLIQRYGTKIPVIKRMNHHEELAWPFDHHQLLQLINA